MADNDHAARQQQDAARKHAEDTRKKIAADREARDKASKDNAKMMEGVKPTPTQEECDLAAEGVHLSEHEPDGSPEQSNDPTLTPLNKRQAEAKPGTAAGYTTRSATPHS